MNKKLFVSLTLSVFLTALTLPEARALDPILVKPHEHRLAIDTLQPVVEAQPQVEPPIDVENTILVRDVIVRFGDRPTAMILPNRVYSVEILAEHIEGLPLTYEWHLALGAGKLERTGPSTAIWTTGEASRLDDLRVDIVAEDLTTDTARLSISRSKTPQFGGYVLDNNNLPVMEAGVDINGAFTRTAADGSFTLTVPEDVAERFVVNIFKEGFQHSARIATRPERDLKITLDEAQQESFDPSQLIVASSPPLGIAGCRGSLSAGTDWSQFSPQQGIQFIHPDGTVTAGGSPEIQDLAARIEAGFGCGGVFSVAIPPDSLIDQDGNPPTGPVNVSIAAIDHTAPGTMPGDYSVNDGGVPATMFTVGAGSVEIYGNGNRYNLRPGAEAEISIQVAPDMIEALGGALDPSIPLLVYNEKTGLWDIEGQFHLAGAGDIYVATVRHFSTFNADIVKRNPSCVRIESKAISGNYQLEYSGIAPNGAMFVRTAAVNNVASQTHVIYNLPNNTEILLRPFRSAGVPLATYALSTGAAQSPQAPNPPTHPYMACSSLARLVPVPGSTARPAAPQLKGKWQNQLNSKLTLEWTFAGQNVQHFEVLLATRSKAGPYRKLGIVAANKRSEPIDYLVKPCSMNYFKVVAVNGNLRSPDSNLVEAPQNITAIITPTSRVNTPPISIGTLKIGCTKPKPNTLFSGAAILNRSARDGVLQNAPGTAGFLFPRDQRLQGVKTRLITGKSYDAGSNVAIFTRFNSWSTVKRNEYLVAFTDGTNKIVSVVAGDLDDPAPLPNGSSIPGIIMLASPDPDPLKSIGGITPRAPWGGTNPTATEPGYIFGEFDTNVFQPPNANPVNTLLAGMGFNVKFYMPLYYDDRF